MIREEEARVIFEDLLDELEDNGVSIPKVWLRVVEDDFNGMAAAYDPNSSVIKLSSGINRDGAEKILAHEIAHVLRLENSNLLTSKDLADLVDTANDIQLKNILRKLVSSFTILSRVWTNEDAVDDTIDQIDNIMEGLSHWNSLDKDGENAETWKWISANYDKIYDSIDYYSVGGHDSEWFDKKAELEDILDIKIPTTESRFTK